MSHKPTKCVCTHSWASHSIWACVQSIDKFQVKIGDKNQSSLKLFAKLGFMQVSHSQIFHEATLDLPVTEAIAMQYQQAAALLEFGTYD